MGSAADGEARARHQKLADWVSEHAERLDVPGVAAGVLHLGEEEYAFHGITSVENPLPVNHETLFQFGSTGKTFTATAIMRLVDRGRVDLDDPVRSYVPELHLKDEQVAEKVTVLNLLNHTAGWAGDLIEDTGPGHDAIAKYVEQMAELEQVTPLGAAVSYNNASLVLAGRIIEKVTDEVFENAIRELLFEPLGLEHTFFFPTEVMTRRFAVGHNQQPDGSITIARPWSLPRSLAPSGGISANAGDQIAWARFHLGDGRGPDGTRVLSEQLLRQMQTPTVETGGSAIGDAVGLGWMLKDVDGIRLVEHGGTTNGQHSMFTMVPEHEFAVVSLTNCGPNGHQFNDELKRWALERYVGVVEAQPELMELEPAQLQQYAGTFETISNVCRVRVTNGELSVDIEYKPEFVAELQESAEDAPPAPPPVTLGMLPGDQDQFVITDGPLKGMRGYFTRDESGRIDGINLGGRLAVRTEIDAPA